MESRVRVLRRVRALEGSEKQELDLVQPATASTGRKPREAS